MSKAEPVLFHCPEQRSLAESIVALEPSITLGSTRGTRKGFEDAQMWEDETPDIVISEWREDRRVNVVYLASFHNRAVYYEQWSAMVQLRQMTTERLTIILPFFPTAQMDRSDYVGRVIAAQTMARWLSCIDDAGAGVTELVIYDPHLKQLRGYFHGKTRIEFKEPFSKHFTPIVQQELGVIGRDVFIAHPDEGSVKRFGHFEGEVVCTKRRVPGSDPIVVIADGDPRGKNMLIIDDIWQSGGTSVKCKDALLSAGANSVSVLITHAVNPTPKSDERMLNSGFERVFFSNSIPTTHNRLDGKGPCIGMSLAQSMANVVRDIDGR